MDFTNQEFAKAHCNYIRELDNLIRFVGIANGMGTLLATSYREQLRPLLNDDETRLYAMQAVLRADLREDFQKNMGTLIYSVGKYDKLLRATIPVFGKNSEKFYILFSFDVGAYVFNILENKIISYIRMLKEH